MIGLLPIYTSLPCRYASSVTIQKDAGKRCYYDNKDNFTRANNISTITKNNFAGTLGQQDICFADSRLILQ